MAFTAFDKSFVFPDVENRGLPPALFTQIVETNHTCNYHIHLGLYLTWLAPGEAAMGLRVADYHINPRDIAHGAVAYALLDTVMGMAIRTIDRNVVTIHSSMNHTLPTRLGDVLTAKGTILESGKKIILAESAAYNQDGQLVALSRGTFYDKGPFLEMRTE